MSTDIEYLLAKLRLSLKDQPPIKKFVVFGSAISSNTPNDLDIALIVEDGTDIFSFTKRIAEIVSNLVVQNNLFINVVPISKSDYSQSKSQFIQNVRDHGKLF